ncbi:MAG: DUF2634 domain-containing protein [Roseburia sp.]|nr:DUF2634 domain-containing protein [Roseburia sp.]
MGLFPSYIENDTELRTENKTTLPKEYGIDFETGQLTGLTVTGKEAVKVWIYLALRTPRYRHYAYTWDYGSEFEDLIGQGYTEEYIYAETKRMTEECLLINRDIQSITDFIVDMADDTLTISFVANTIYGSIGFENQAI